MIRQIGRDGGVKVTSPERPAKKHSRTSSLLRSAQQAEEEMQSIHATLTAMESAVHDGLQGPPARTQRSYASQQVEQQSKEIVDVQEFLAETRARIEELSEIQEQANTIRRIAVGQTGYSSTSSNPATESGTVEGAEPLEQELAPLEPLFHAGGVTLQHRTNILNIFRVASGGADRLDLDGFTDVMVWLHVPREYCKQYFKAFDLDLDGTIDYREFLLGLIAMDSTTAHEGMWAEMRARYIFKTYDVNENRRLDLAELTHLVRHLRRGRGDSTRPHEIEAEAVAVMDALCSNSEDEVSFDAFLGALPPFGDVVTGTTVLFRLGTQTSPKELDISSTFSDDSVDTMRASSDWTGSETNNETSNMRATQSSAEHVASSSRADPVPSSRPSLAQRDGVQYALHEGRVRRDDLRLALRFCQSMPGPERKAFLREFFQEFQTDADSDEDEGGTESEDISAEDEFDRYEMFRDGESALDLENYNWVADPGPHPGVRGLGSDVLPGSSEDPTGAPPRANFTQESRHTERVDSVLEEFEKIMDSDPSTIDFFTFLSSELKAVRGRDQQNRVLAAVRNTLAHEAPDDSAMGVSTGMGIAAELLGTQQGDRLPSRRGRRTKLSTTATEADLRPDLRPGSAPSEQMSGLCDTDPMVRPTSAEGRSFINSSFPPADTVGDAQQHSRPSRGASSDVPSHYATIDHNDVYTSPRSGAYDYVETADSASSVSTASSYRDDTGGLDYTDRSYVEAIQACTDGNHLGNGYPQDREGIDSADDSSADQSDYSNSSSESDACSGSATHMDTLTREYSSEIRHNEAVGCELSNVLTTLIEAGKTLNEAADTGNESVTLTVQHLEMVSQRILAVAEGHRQCDARLRETIVAVHLKYAGMDATAYKDALVQEVSDILYDEMIFSKVVQQVEHSYDEDIGALHQHMRPGEEIGDVLRDELQQLLEQRHNDLDRLHQEREKRLVAKQQHPSPDVVGTRASHPMSGSECGETAATMSKLSEMEPDTSDTSETDDHDEDSAISDDDDPPVELFPSHGDKSTDAESNDSDGLGSWSAESDLGGPPPAGDMRAHDPVTIDDLPEESLLDKEAEKAASNTQTDNARPETGLLPSAVELVVKIDTARKQELMKMMEEEQRETFPADGLPEAGNDGLDIVPDPSSLGNDSEVAAVGMPTVNGTDAQEENTVDAASTADNDAVSPDEPQDDVAASSDNGSGIDNDSVQECPPPQKWELADLDSASGSSVSKKMLLGWLKENCSTQLLQKHGLSGAFRNVMKKRKREDLVAAYKAHLDSAAGEE